MQELDTSVEAPKDATQTSSTGPAELRGTATIRTDDVMQTQTGGAEKRPKERSKLTDAALKLAAEMGFSDEQMARVISAAALEPKAPVHTGNGRNGRPQTDGLDAARKGKEQVGGYVPIDGDADESRRDNGAKGGAEAETETGRKERGVDESSKEAEERATILESRPGVETEAESGLGRQSGSDQGAERAIHLARLKNQLRLVLHQEGPCAFTSLPGKYAKVVGHPLKLSEFGFKKLQVRGSSLGSGVLARFQGYSFHAFWNCRSGQVFVLKFRQKSEAFMRRASIDWTAVWWKKPVSCTETI
jgi:hypothetical protein